MSLESKLVSCLTDDLRRAPYKGQRNPLRGHCYVASEALFHLRGGKAAGLKPMFIQHEGAPHWFLADTKNREILDLTAGQFKTPVPYHLAQGKGFLTLKPSKRAAELIRRVATSRRDRVTQRDGATHQIKAVNVEDVIATHAKLYRQGRHREAPTAAYRAMMETHGTDWVLVRLPLSLLNYQRADDAGPERLARAQKYSERSTEFPPGIATYRGRKRTAKAFVSDGNHRTLAAEIRGDRSIRMFMPCSEYEALVADSESKAL